MIALRSAARPKQRHQLVVCPVANTRRRNVRHPACSFAIHSSREPCGRLYTAEGVSAGMAFGAMGECLREVPTTWDGRASLTAQWRADEKQQLPAPNEP